MGHPKADLPAEIMDWSSSRALHDMVCGLGMGPRASGVKAWS